MVKQTEEKLTGDGTPSKNLFPWPGPKFLISCSFQYIIISWTCPRWGQNPHFPINSLKYQLWILLHWRPNLWWTFHCRPSSGGHSIADHRETSMLLNHCPCHQRKRARKGSYWTSYEHLSCLFFFLVKAGCYWESRKCSVCYLQVQDPSWLGNMTRPWKETVRARSSAWSWF